MVQIENVLRRPVVTEKTMAQKDKFCFEVHIDASKEDVMKSVKEFYGVSPVKVNMIMLPEKTKTIRRGQIARKRAPFKKAIVTLEKGSVLDFNAFK